MVDILTDYPFPNIIFYPYLQLSDNGNIGTQFTPTKPQMMDLISMQKMKRGTPFLYPAFMEMTKRSTPTEQRRIKMMLLYMMLGKK